MAIGGSKFLLEKTWKASTSTTTTFNAPGNIVVPYGRSDVIVTGRGGTGIGSTPSTIAAYNPSTPGTLTYNPISGGNFSYSNSPVPGYTEYNPPSGGNYAGGNPPSGGNYAGYNPGSGGNPITNTTYTLYVYAEAYNQNVVNGATTFTPYSLYLYDANPIACPSPQSGYNSYFQQYFSNYYSCGPLGETPGNIVGYNPSSGGNIIFNPYIEGNATYNPITPGDPYYVPFTPGFTVYNPVSGGNYAGGNPAVPGNANYNAGTGPVPGTPTNVLGVTMPGGNPGQVASVVSPTTINRYQFPDGTTYPVVVPTGSYVTITVS